MPQSQSPFTIRTAPTTEPVQEPTPAIVQPTPEPQPVRRQSPFTVASPEAGSIGSIVRDIPVVGNAIADYGKQAVDYVAPYAAPVISKLSPVFDILSRGQYASAAFFDSNMDDSKSFFDSVAAGFNELLPASYAYSPQMKLSFSDVFARRDPTFVKENPKAATILGFLGDVALDPTSYLGLGLTKTGVKLGTQVLTKEGEELLTKAISKGSKTVFQGGDNTLALLDKVASESRRPFKELKKTGTLEERLAKYDTSIKNQYKADVQEINDRIFSLPEEPTIKVREATQPTFGGDKELSVTAEKPLKAYSLGGPSSERRQIRVFWNNPPEGFKYLSPIHHGKRENVLMDLMVEGRTTTQGDTAMFLSELQSDMIQKGKNLGTTIPFKNNWVSKGLDYAIQEAKAKGFDGILLPKTAEQINEIQKWGGIVEKDGKWFDAGGANVTAVIKRYIKELPELARKKMPETTTAKTVDLASIPEEKIFSDKATRSVAEISLMEETANDVPGMSGPAFFFNRLQVPKEAQGQGIGNKLLKQVTDFADQHGLPIVNEVKAYGGLSQEELVKFYEKAGFKNVPELEGLMVYNPKATTTKGIKQLETRFIQGDKRLEELWYLPLKQELKGTKNPILNSYTTKSGVKVNLEDFGNGYRLAGINTPEANRGKGLGTEAIKEIQAKAASEGKPIYLTASANSKELQEPLNRFYERLGFTKFREDPLSGKPMYVWSPKEANKAALAAADIAAQGASKTVNPIERLKLLKSKEAEFNAAKAEEIAKVNQRYEDLLTRNTNQFYGGPRQHIIAPLVNELANQGYFQAVKTRVNAFNDIIKGVKGTTRGNNVLATKLAKAEVFKDLNMVDTVKLTAEEFRERIEKRILDVINVLPPSAPIFAKKGLYVKVGLPFGKQKDLFRIIGTDKLGDTIKSLNNSLVAAGRFGKLIGKVEDTVGAAFNRNYGLPEEYIKLRNEVENALGESSNATVRDAVEIAGKLTKENRDKIGKTMQEIDDATRELEKTLGRQLTEEEGVKVVTDGLRANRLNASEKAATAILYQDYKDMALAEMRAGLLQHNLINYSPRGYNAIVDAEDMTKISRGKFREAGGPNPYLASSQERKYLTNAEAKAAGLDLETDAMVLYAHRLLSHRRAMAVQQFKDSVTELFGTYTPNTKYAKTGILPTGVVESSDIPKRVMEDMRMIGDAVLPAGMNDSIKNIVKFLQFTSMPFKTLATRARPTFAMRQVVSNTIQSAMVSGIKAFKAFDPRSAADAFFLTWRSPETKQLPEFVSNLINTAFKGSDAVLAERTVMSQIAGEAHLQDFAKHWHMTNPFGEKITGVEMVDEMRKNGVLRGFDVTGDSFSRKLNDELDRTLSNKSVAFELGKYWKHAQLVEDYNRAMLYINGRRLGHSPTESAGLVNKALFDYSRGLSAAERTFAKTLVPFYSFQRFAIPFVIKETLKQPGTYATTQKFISTLEKLISSGETLNPSERESIPNTLLEQPNLYVGFDKDGKAVFNPLNNLTPYDVMNLTVTKKDGTVDYQRTVEKSVLGALLPFVKIPLELLAKKSFFTGQSIAKTAGQQGDLSTNLGRVLPETVKQALSWEERVDPRTGKKATFVNPWLAYTTMSYLPILKDYVKPLDGATSVQEAAMDIFLANINPSKRVSIDLKSASEWEMLSGYSEIQDVVKQLKYAQMKGSDPNKPGSEAELLQKQIQDLIKVFGENATRKGQYEIRGQGIGGVSTDPEINKATINPVPQTEQRFK